MKQYKIFVVIIWSIAILGTILGINRRGTEQLGFYIHLFITGFLTSLVFFDKQIEK